MSTKHPNEQTKIIIQPSSWKTRTYDAREEERARKLIREEVLLKRNEPYFKVRAKLKHADDGKLKSVVAYLLRANTYTADVVEISTDETYGVREIKEGAAVVDTDDDASARALGEGSYDSFADVDVVVASCVAGEIASAGEAVRAIAEIAASAGLRVRTLMDSEATVANYQAALASGLRIFFNVGHGYTGGIVLEDGNLTAAWFSSLTGRQVSPAVVYFNSCQVFNPPLQPAVMSAGARTFVGGIVNLLIGPSEEVAKDFFRRILLNNEAMGTALQEAERTKYPNTGCHGISGDLGPFGSLTNQVIVYEHDNYGGRSRSLAPGRYDVTQIGLPNDCISSLRVPNGLKVTLFQHAGFSGNSITFTADASSVGSFNDQTSAIIVEQADNAPAVDIYEHRDFLGMRKQLGPGRYNVSEIGLPNDCVSSVRVGRGLKVTLYKHKDFAGDSVTYVRDSSWVGSFNDQTSSIVVERIPLLPAGVEIFEHADYLGRGNVLGVGSYNVSELGLPNDTLTSLRVPKGFRVTLFEHANFQGSSVTYTQSTSNVGSFNDKTSSIRVARIPFIPQPPLTPSDKAGPSGE